jgi:type III secretory pathway component EscS
VFTTFSLDFFRPSVWTYTSFLLALLTLPIFAALTAKARRSSLEDRVAEELLERVTAGMKGGSGFEESAFMALKVLGMLRNGRPEHTSLEDILEDLEARSKGRVLRFVLSTIRTIRRVSTVSPDVLDDLLDDVKIIRRIERQLREGGKHIVLLSLVMASLVIPSIMGLVVNYVATFTPQAGTTTLYVWSMVGITSVTLTLFGGVIADDVARFASAAPSLLAIASIVFDIALSIRLV